MVKCRLKVKGNSSFPFRFASLRVEFLTKRVAFEIGAGSASKRSLQYPRPRTNDNEHRQKASIKFPKSVHFETPSFSIPLRSLFFRNSTDFDLTLPLSFKPSVP